MERVFTDFHLFCGSGGGALGFSWATRTYGSLRGRFRSLGGVDSHPRRCLDFGLLLGKPATCLDLFSAEDYLAFHGKPPPDGWREATPADIRAAAGGERPDVVFTSAPCKGFSGLLSGAKAASAKYQALNRLTLRGIWLALEAWSDDPPGFIVFENVPRIVQRGAALLDQIVGLLGAYGYAVHRDSHDCGELGGLAQHRNRFLLLARHIRRVKPFVYKPDLQRVRAIGEVVGPMPLPEDPAGGETWFLARAFRALRAEKPEVRAVLSYSDPIPRLTAGGEVVKPGHIGVIYQAHNGRYVGRGGARTIFLDDRGRVVSGRALSKLRCDTRGRAYAEKVLLDAGAPTRREGEDGRAYVRRALAEGPFRAVWHPGNHAYVWPLDRAAAAAAAPALPYPKGGVA